MASIFLLGTIIDGDCEVILDHELLIIAEYILFWSGGYFIIARSTDRNQTCLLNSNKCRGTLLLPYSCRRIAYGH